MKTIKGKVILVDDQPLETHLPEDALYEKNWNIHVEFLAKSRMHLTFSRKMLMRSLLSYRI